MKRESRHQCLIYEGSPSEQLPVLAFMIKRKLNEGYRCLYMNSRPVVAGMQSYLAAIGIDVAHDIAKGRLVLSSEPAASADGDFDIDVMLQKLEDAVDLALNDGFKGLWASGDMSWELGPEKNFAKLMEYERRLEELFHQRRALFGICQYHRDTLPRHVMRQALLSHRAIFINETLSRVNPHYIPSGRLSHQKATDSELDETITELCRLQNKVLVPG